MIVDWGVGGGEMIYVSLAHLYVNNYLAYSVTPTKYLQDQRCNAYIVASFALCKAFKLP